MPDLDNKTMNQRVRLNIRVSRNSLAFAVSDPTAVNQVVYEPYIVKSGISLAANLTAARSHSTSVCVKLKHTLRVPDKDVSRLSVLA